MPRYLLDKFQIRIEKIYEFQYFPEIVLEIIMHRCSVACCLWWDGYLKVNHYGSLVSRGQTSFLALGVIVCSISAQRFTGGWLPQTSGSHDPWLCTSSYKIVGLNPVIEEELSCKREIGNAHGT